MQIATETLCAMDFGSLPAPHYQWLPCFWADHIDSALGLFLISKKFWTGAEDGIFGQMEEVLSLWPWLCPAQERTALRLLWYQASRNSHMQYFINWAMSRKHQGSLAISFQLVLETSLIYLCSLLRWMSKESHVLYWAFWLGTSLTHPPDIGLLPLPQRGDPWVPVMQHHACCTGVSRLGRLLRLCSGAQKSSVCFMEQVLVT